jgi:hypothetical protein
VWSALRRKPEITTLRNDAAGFFFSDFIILWIQLWFVWIILKQLICPHFRMTSGRLLSWFLLAFSWWEILLHPISFLCIWRTSRLAKYKIYAIFFTFLTFHKIFNIISTDQTFICSIQFQ